MTSLLIASSIPAVLLLGGILAARRRFTSATVRGGSMTPTFDDGTRVLAARRHTYRPGEVIVFRATSIARGDPSWRIKRVAAIAGDPVPDWMPQAPATVPAGFLVVAGDNPHSQDSRQLGYIPLRAVAGRVIRVLPHRRRPSDALVQRANGGGEEGGVAWALGVGCGCAPGLSIVEQTGKIAVWER